MRRIAGFAVALVVVAGVAVGLALGHAAPKAGKPARPSVISSARVGKASTARTYSIKVAGLKRRYEVITPTRGLPKSAPVIVFLSGIGVSASREITRDELVPYSDAGKAELVYPVAVDNSWNADGCCGKAASHKVNDLAFIKAVMAWVDPGHKRPGYLAGYSNGARMAYRVACTDPGLFDGYAAAKGDPTRGCVLRKPVTIMQIASVNDPEVPYKPRDKGSSGEKPQTTLVFHVHAADKCPAKSTVTHSGTLTLTIWSGCGNGTRLAFAVWSVGVHSFPRTPVSKPTASQVIWAFFTKTALAPLPA